MALRQLPLSIDPLDVDMYHNCVEEHPDWDYTQVTNALKEAWRGPDEMTLERELHSIRYEPQKENFWQFCTRLRRVFIAAKGAGYKNRDLIFAALNRAPRAAQTAACIQFRGLDGKLGPNVTYNDVARFLNNFLIDNPHEIPGHAPPSYLSSSSAVTAAPVAAAHSADTPDPAAPLAAAHTPTRNETPADLNMPDATCYNCGGRGHFSSICPSQRRARSTSRHLLPAKRPCRADESRKVRRLRGTVSRLRQDLRVASAMPADPRINRRRSRRPTPMSNADTLQALGKAVADAIHRYAPKNE